MNTLISRFSLLLSLLLCWGPLLAHGVRVHAFADGSRIVGAADFDGGGSAEGVRIRVLDSGGSVLADLTPDDEGAFVYQAKAPIDHLVVLETGDGHRAQWPVTAAELAPGFPAMIHGRPDSAMPGLEPSLVEGPGDELDPMLIAAIEQAVARQIRPLREALIAADARTGWRDILGGIGYILGLAGLLAWWRSRRSNAPL